MLSVLLMATLSQQVHAQLLASARATGRPPECTARTAGGARSTIWQQARSPKRLRYCRLIALAQARLRTDPASARRAATTASKLLPDRAAPHVVLARAALASDDIKTAKAAFERALKLEPRSVDQPLAMHALARTQRRAGQLDAALRSYRRLAPRAALLPTRKQRAGALLEAAHVAMAQAGASTEPATAERHLDEALAFLREAARDPHHGLHNDVLLSLALALDRAGMAAQADAVLAEQRGAGAWLRHNQGKPPAYVTAPGDHLALRALAAQGHDRKAASASWARYLNQARLPAAFAKAARKRRDNMGADKRRPGARRRARRRPR